MSRLTDYFDAVFQDPDPLDQLIDDALGGGGGGGTWVVPSGPYAGLTWAQLMAGLRSNTITEAAIRQIVAQSPPAGGGGVPLGPGAIDAQIKANRPTQEERPSITPPLSGGERAGTGFIPGAGMGDPQATPDQLADQATKGIITPSAAYNTLLQKGYSPQGAIDFLRGKDVPIQDITPPSGAVAPGQTSTGIGLTGAAPAVSQQEIQNLRAQGFGPDMDEADIINIVKNARVSPSDPLVADAWRALQAFLGYSPERATAVMSTADPQGRFQPPAQGTTEGLTPPPTLGQPTSQPPAIGLPGSMVGTLTPTGPNMASPTGRTVEQIRAAGTYINDAERQWFLQQLQAQGVPLGQEAQAFLGTAGGGQLTPSGGGVVPGWLNAPVTQGYGPTSTTLDSSYKGAAHFNKGIDYAVPIGTPIEALRGGTVVNAGDAGDGWGTSVKVRDAEGNIVNYGHLSAANVKVGDQIQPGQVVGASGNTGKSTGPHLSLDIQNAAGEWIDPTPLIEAAKTGSTTGATGGAPTIPGYDPQAVATLYDAARQAGFTGDALNRAVASALAETGGNFRAENRSALGVQENSMGAWQINLDAHADKVPGATFEDKVEWLKDPYNAAQIAFQVSSGGTDFSPWSVWHENVGAPAQAIYSQLNAAAPSGDVPFGASQEELPFGASPEEQQVLTRLQQLDADFGAGKFGAGAAAEAEYLRQKAAIEADLARVQAQIEAQQTSQQRAQAEASLAAAEQQYGRIFRLNPTQGFYYDADGRQVPINFNPGMGQWSPDATQFPVSGNRFVTQAGPEGREGIAAITNPARAQFISQEVGRTGQFPITPQQAAVVANLGQVRGAEYLKEELGLQRTPTLPEINALIGTSIGPRAVTDLEGNRLEANQLAALAGGPMLPGGGGARGSDAAQRFQAMAEQAYPNDPVRQQQYVQANLGTRNIAIATDKAPFGVNRPKAASFEGGVYRDAEGNVIERQPETLASAENLQGIAQNFGFRVVPNPNPPPPFALVGPDGQIIRTFATQTQAMAQLGILGHQYAVRQMEQAKARQGDPFGAGNIGRSIDTGVNRALVRAPSTSNIVSLAPPPRRETGQGRPWAGNEPEPVTPPTPQPPYQPPEPRQPGIIWQAQGGVNVAGAGGAGMNAMNGFNTPGEIGMFRIDERGNPIQLLSVAGEGPDGLGGMTAPEQITVQPQGDVTLGRELAALANARYPVRYRLTR